MWHSHWSKAAASTLPAHQSPPRPWVHNSHNFPQQSRKPIYVTCWEQQQPLWLKSILFFIQYTYNKMECKHKVPWGFLLVSMEFSCCSWTLFNKRSPELTWADPLPPSFLQSIRAANDTWHIYRISSGFHLSGNVFLTDGTLGSKLAFLKNAHWKLT